MDGKPPPARRHGYTDQPGGGPPASEAKHFIRCPTCGAWLDVRDLHAVFAHQGPPPHPKEDQSQSRSGLPRLR